MFDINGGEFLIIALVAVIVVGPERLPEYVRGLRSGVRRARTLLNDGRTALRDEFGEDVDWSQLDPRQYDPRRIVRDALADGNDTDTPATGTAAVATVAATSEVGVRRARRKAAAGAPAQAEQAADAAPAVPFDAEAT